MRLIDANALKEKLQDHAHNGTYAAFYVNSSIDNAPTVCEMFKDERPQNVVTIPHELIEKLALCVVDTVKNIDWDKAIEAYKERPTGEWVPVSERLPDVGNKEYLVTVDYEGLIVTCQRIFFNDQIGWNDDNECVVAWQPLPEPYKEGGEEE